MRGKGNSKRWRFESSSKSSSVGGILRLFRWPSEHIVIRPKPGSRPIQKFSYWSIDSCSSRGSHGGVGSRTGSGPSKANELRQPGQKRMSPRTDIAGATALV